MEIASIVCIMPNQTAEKGCFSMKKGALGGEHENKSLLISLFRKGETPIKPFTL